jgi:hypothetical protein
MMQLAWQAVRSTSADQLVTTKNRGCHTLPIIILTKPAAGFPQDDVIHSYLHITAETISVTCCTYVLPFIP